jgi:hypothetical protein
MVYPGISASSFIAQSTCFVFDGLWVITFNDEISCRTKLDVPGPMTGAVHAKSLVSVLEHMTDEEIDLTGTKQELQIKGTGDRKKIAIRMEAEIKLPIRDVVPPSAEEWGDLPEDFSRAVKQVCAVTTKNEEEFLTAAVHIHPEWIEASDRTQACRCRMELPVERSFLTRSKSLKHVVGLDLTRMAEKGDWLHLRNKTLVFSLRRHIESYPDLSEGFKFRGTPMSLPKGATEAARLGSIFSSEDKESDRVKVVLTNKQMTVYGQGEHGHASTDLETSYVGEEVAFWLSPKMLEQLIEQFNSCEIGPEKLSVQGSSWSYVVALSKDKTNEVKSDALSDDSEEYSSEAGTQDGEEAEDFEGAF